MDKIIKLIGYCSLSPGQVLNNFNIAGAKAVFGLDGEYVIVIEDSNECHIFVSPCGVCQYYYTILDNHLYHDDTVIGVVEKSGLTWAWNWSALADVLQLDHVLENDTLHPSINRAPAGGYIRFEGGQVSLSTPNVMNLDENGRVSASDALNVFNDANKKWLDERAVVSMSAGFDSRVILSSVLSAGYKPRLLSMGYDNSTDVVVSRSISSDLDLPLDVVSLEADDYIKYGKRISRVTNGTKTAWHWHTFLYPLGFKSKDDAVLFVGSNGEFARSFYYDNGVLAIWKNLWPQKSLHDLWRRRVYKPFRINEISRLNPSLAGRLIGDGGNIRIERMVGLCHGSFLAGLDRFYLEQRVRNFIGNGLRLYSETFSWRAPFLDLAWIRAAWNLKRSWKFGSNWHRFAINSNCPNLLNYTEQGISSIMSQRAKLFYWAGRRNKQPIVPYANYEDWYCGKDIVGFLRENINVVSDVIDPTLVEEIIVEHLLKKNRALAISFIISLMFWLLNLKEIRCENNLKNYASC